MVRQGLRNLFQRRNSFKIIALFAVVIVGLFVLQTNLELVNLGRLEFAVIILGSFLLTFLSLSSDPVKNGFAITERTIFFFLFAVGFLQNYVANELPTGLLPLNALNGFPLLMLISGSIVSILISLGLAKKFISFREAIIVAISIYSSTAFFRVYAVHEVGEHFILVFGFILLSIVASGDENENESMIIIPKRIMVSGLILVLLGFVSLVLSPVPNQSLIKVLNISSLVAAGWLAAKQVKSSNNPRLFVWTAFLLSMALPLMLAAIKFGQMVIDFGILNTLAYRFHPTEMDGANVFARSIVLSSAIGWTILNSGKRYYSRWTVPFVVFIQVLGLASLFWSRSFEGLFAWGGVLVVFFAVILAKSSSLKKAISRRLRVVLIALALCFLILAVLLGIKFAPKINIYSFNGRFAHWQAAIESALQKPLFGIGPDNEYYYAKNAGKTSILDYDQSFVDDPLYVTRFNWGLLRLHAHNNFLEWGAFFGIPSLILLLFLLVGLVIWLVRSFWRGNDGTDTTILAAILVIAGEMLWGMLDTLRESPPLISFPVWLLMGLAIGVAVNKGPTDQVVKSRSVRMNYLLLSLALLTMMIYSSSGYFFAKGIDNFNFRNWTDAIENFRIVTKINPLSHEAYWLQHKAELALGKFEDAQIPLDSAIANKQNYSPYLIQAGWLSWYLDSIDQAEKFFSSAINSDPYESWGFGSHFALGLLESSKGNTESAVDLIATSLYIHPELVSNPYWSETESGIALTSGFMNFEAKPVEIIKLMLNVAGFTERNIPISSDSGQISLKEILDQVKSLEPKHLSIASTAEAAKVAGDFRYANDQYKDYQQLFPESSFGYRELARMYLDEGRLVEAKEQISRALAVSPKDLSSQQLALQISIMQGNFESSEQFLKSSRIAASQQSFQLRLFDPAYQLLNAEYFALIGNNTEEKEYLKFDALTTGRADSWLKYAIALSKEDRERHDAYLNAYSDLRRRLIPVTDPRYMVIVNGLMDLDLHQFSAAIDFSDKDYFSNIMMGLYQNRRGDYESAFGYYENALQIRPWDGDAHLLLANAAITIGKTDIGREELLITSDLNPYSSFSLIKLSELSSSSGESLEAVKYAEGATNLEPRAVLPWIRLGNLQLLDSSLESKHSYLNASRITDTTREFTKIYLLPDLEVDTPQEFVEAGFVKGALFSIDGNEVATLFMHPSSSSEFELSLPKVESNSRLLFKSSVAISPDAWSQAGDGVEFIVSVADSNGNHKQLLSVYIDPKNNEQDREWKNIELDLTQHTGQSIKLILETTPGPSGDDRFDWAGWGNPRILMQPMNTP